MVNERRDKHRYFLKDSIRRVIDFSQTDQNRGIAPPPIEKPYSKETRLINLPQNDQFNSIGRIDIEAAISNGKGSR